MLFMLIPPLRLIHTKPMQSSLPHALLCRICRRPFLETISYDDTSSRFQKTVHFKEKRFFIKGMAETLDRPHDVKCFIWKACSHIVTKLKYGKIRHIIVLGVFSR